MYCGVFALMILLYCDFADGGCSKNSKAVVGNVSRDTVQL